MVESKAKFSKVKDKLISVARITLVLELSQSDKIEIVNVIDLSGIPDLEIAPTPEFIAAAGRGITKTVDALAARAAVSSLRLIKLKSLSTWWPDTHEDAVECAAGIAPFLAWLPTEPEPEIIFTNKWELRLWQK